MVKKPSLPPTEERSCGPNCVYPSFCPLTNYCIVNKAGQHKQAMQQSSANDRGMYLGLRRAI